MSYGIVDLSNSRAPIVMLGQAQLCQDCEAISSAPTGTCERCGSFALLSLASVLNRNQESRAEARKGGNHG
jgi:predicted ATP-dependent serine protease